MIASLTWPSSVKIRALSACIYLCLQHASNAATSSQTSVGGGSGAGGSAGGSAGSGITSRPSPGPTGHVHNHGHGHGHGHFRHGLLQLMIHSIDPMHDGKYGFNCLSYTPGLVKSIVLWHGECVHERCNRHTFVSETLQSLMYIFHYLLSSWEPVCPARTPENLRHLWNLKVYYCVQESPAVVLILNMSLNSYVQNHVFDTSKNKS